MSEEETRVEVEIFGEKYVVRGDATPDHVIRLARHVDKIMRDVVARNPRLTVHKAAILSAMIVADEMKKLRDEYDGLVELLKQETQKEK
ncbi:MAG: cell division protein ZapA [Bacillota bacterium]